MTVQHRAKEQGVLHKLVVQLAERLGVEEADSICEFARIMCRSVGTDELARRPREELLGELIESWRFIERYPTTEPKIKLVNPQLEQHGWQSSHSLLMVLSRDMPFLIDSVRMELNRRQVTIHAISNGIISAQRDSSGHLLALEPSDGGDESAESIITLAIQRITAAELISELQHDLRVVLDDVDRVTTDFNRMRDAAAQLIPAYQENKTGLSTSLVTQACGFLQWMLDNHFTFLGYRKLEPTGEGEGVRIVAGSRLGVMRQKTGRRKITTRQRYWPAESIQLSDLVCFAKSPRRSRVHRPAYSDVITLRLLNADGSLAAEHQFLGLYTSAVYFQSSTLIPVVNQKIAGVVERANLHPGSHDYKALKQILEVYPRDDLFQSTEDELYHTALGILHIHERRQVRCFFRRDPFGRYYSVMAFIPRDIFTTDLRQQVQQILCEELEAEQVEFNTFFSESILSRTQFILHLGERAKPKSPDYELIEQRVIAATHSWWDRFQTLLSEVLGEETGFRVAQHFTGGIPASYREDFAPRSAVTDAQTLMSLDVESPLALNFYRPLDQGEGQLNFKVFHFGQPLPLSDIIPILENLGLRVIDEHPYRLECDGQPVWIHDFRMEPQGKITAELEHLRTRFEEAFREIWQGEAENDPFNRLVLIAALDWREVAMLRAQAAYMKQTGFPFAGPAIAAALTAHHRLCQQLVELFYLRLHPKNQSTADAVKLADAIQSGIDEVSSLTDDRILRRLLEQLLAIQRTNFYQQDATGKGKSSLAFKFNSGAISQLPEPVPITEIFVCSPRVEGVHLRNGLVARGGLRWSDRLEDFRTEILGLVKAQQVKNAVIVPVGAKGGFVCKKLDAELPSSTKAELGVACYREFIGGLLDLTDNLINGELEHPSWSICHDGDDPYLVVAADKGTAAFSDIANDVARERRFWLGDAFASGGSQGYDHKRLGITARGAWVAVQRHFRERGIDVQTTPITVVGIGDMGGDVFGNGLLLSKTVRLVAAFNHQHIFIDPDPDPAVAFTERQRLFAAGGGWDSYDPERLSAGGGVFSRSAKTVHISAAMKRHFALTGDRMTPSELIHQLLKSPVDLLWNGGIGTYVKSEAETHQAVGDKANDSIRINASELRCRVVGEGGNLGMTPLARVEFNLSGGACNGDFVDNSAGVDCSDHEVNIKILLDALVETGELTVKQRNQQLAAISDDVAERVLRNSYRQCQAISIAQRQCQERMMEYRQLISRMEQRGRLPRALEQLPDDDQLARRQQAGQGLARSELAILMAYTKAELKLQLATAEVAEDPLMSQALTQGFPAPLVAQWPHALTSHRLRKELIASQLANQVVHYMGLTYLTRMKHAANADTVEACRAFQLMTSVYRLEHWWHAIEVLDNHIDAQVQLKMMAELQRLIRRASRWILRSREGGVDGERELQRFGASMEALINHLGDWLHGSLAQKWRDRFYFYNQAGVPDPLAEMIASVDGLYVGLAIIEVAEQTGAALQQVVTVYCQLGEQLDIFWYSRRVDELAVSSGWQAQARESFRDELDAQVRCLAVSIISSGNEGECDGRFQQWAQHNQLPITRWLTMLDQLRGERSPDYAAFAVVSRELGVLANACCESKLS